MKKFFAMILAFLVSLWNKADQLVKRVTPVAIGVVNEVKKINESFTGDIIETIITAVIPGTADDKIIKTIRDKLRTTLPKVLTVLNISQSIAQIEDPNEQLKAIINAINLSSDEAKNTYYHGLCALIIQDLSDGKVTWSEAVQIAEYYYTNIYKKG